MKKILPLVLCWCLLLTGCGPLAFLSPPTPSATPDPCSPQNLPGEATKVNNLMRQFDDYSSLAFGTPQSQLLQIIPQMQDVRRAAEDQPVPACLKDLKQLQLMHMQVTLDTLIAFQANRTNTDLVNAGIQQARKYHDEYTLELASLLNLTVVVQPSGTPAPPAPPTPEASVTPLPPGTPVTATNPGPNVLNLHAGPTVGSATIATMAVGQSAKVYAKLTTGDWLLIESPAQPGSSVWVYAPLVQLNVDISVVPLVTPSP
jgi:hypothetical protein